MRFIGEEFELQFADSPKVREKSLSGCRGGYHYKFIFILSILSLAQVFINTLFITNELCVCLFFTYHLKTNSEQDSN